MRDLATVVLSLSLSLSRSLIHTYVIFVINLRASHRRVRMAWDVDNDAYVEPMGGHSELRDLREFIKQSVDYCNRFVGPGANS